MSACGTPGKLLTLSNGASFFRALAAVVLVWLAAGGRESAFLIVLAVALASDLVDGWLARITGTASDFGSRLDGWCDRILFISVLPSLWFLRPDFFRTEAPYAAVIIVAHVLPVLFSLRKFGAVASYHTWLSKASVVAMTAAFYILMLFDEPLPWRVMAVGQVVVAGELAAITATLEKPETDVRSLWHLMRRA